MVEHKASAPAMGVTDDDYYSFMNHPDYRPPVEHQPTPARSDTFYSLMSKVEAEKVFAWYHNSKAVKESFYDNITDIERAIREEPTLGTTPQKEQIIAQSTQELQDYRIEEAYQIRKSRMFWCCFLMNFFGLTLCFYGLSLTVIFEKFDVNKTIFYCSFLFYIPAVVWFVYVFIPCKAERERRKKMNSAIRIRKHFARVRHSRFHGLEDSDDEEEDFDAFEKKANQDGRKSTRSSISKDSKRNSIKNSINGTGTNTGADTGAGKQQARVSMELPKTPARSSIKKAAPSEKKASVQFKF